jgi:four helix bundle protein
MKSYRDLIVWQKSMELVTLTYKLVENFPEKEKFSLVSQLKRSAISIPSNIAEGYGRNYSKDYSRFLQIARGSLFELHTQLDISTRVGITESDDFDDIVSLSIEIEKMLNSLISKINAKSK